MKLDHPIAYVMLAGLAFSGCAPVAATSNPASVTPTATAASTAPTVVATPAQTPASSAPTAAPTAATTTTNTPADSAVVTLFVDGKPFTVDGTLVTASRSQYELGFTFGKATPGDGEAKVAYTQSTTGTTFGLSFTLKGNATAASYVFTTAGLFDNKPDTNATRVVSGAKMDVQYKGSIGSSQDPKVIHIFDLRLKGVSAQ